MDVYILGGSAAIAAALLWSMNSILFTEAGRRIGAFSVNAIRIAIAVALLAAAHVLLLGTIAPAANASQWFWMGASGIVGLGIGDLALFSALVMIGPRRSLLLMSLAPVCAAVFGYLVLEEFLGALAMVGIAITLSDIIVVILDKEEMVQQNAADRKKRNTGLILGAVGGIGQGVGLGLSKLGMVVAADSPAMPLNPLSATLIRMVAGALFVWICLAASGRLNRIRSAFNDGSAIKMTSAGAFIGPFLGVWCSMVAVTYIEVGIAQTLMALAPVMIIPMVWALYRERTSARGILGAAVAVVGVAILFLV